MSLSLLVAPGFTEIPDSAFDAGSVASDSDLKHLNAAAKFAAVRGEQFWGYYRNGEQVTLPASPADGYVYQRSELVYAWSWHWTGSAPNACNGTQVPPVHGATSGQGTILQMAADIDSDGTVSTSVSYYKTSQQDTADGILRVAVMALRLR